MVSLFLLLFESALMSFILNSLKGSFEFHILSAKFYVVAFQSKHKVVSEFVDVFKICELFLALED